MKINFWGVRGSIPAPIGSQEILYKITEVLNIALKSKISQKSQIKQLINSLPSPLAGTTGGNTSCVEIHAGNEIIVMDAGTGIRVLGNKLMTGDFGKGKGRIHLIMSHTHWDHIMGFPFFLPASIKGNTIHIYGCHSDLKDRFRNEHNPKHFPVLLESLSANIEFHIIKPGQNFKVGNCNVCPIDLRHPGVSYGYRIEHGGKKIIYATDAEYKDLSEKGLKKYIDFFYGCDMLIFDAMYTLADALEKEDWGHSTSLIGAEIAMAAKIKNLVLFHHEPNRNDSELQGIKQNTINFIKNSSRYQCNVTLAYEGLEINV